jgi:glycosyltransferase involved in cell wall biosynthesis
LCHSTACIQREIEVIAVDSHTADSELKELEVHYQLHPYIRFRSVHTSNNLSSKRNYGAQISISDYLVFIDDDCIPDKGFLLEYMQVKMIPSSIFCGKVRFDLSLNPKNFYRFRRDLESVNDRLYENTSTLGITNARAMNFGLSKDLMLEHQLYFDEEFTGYGWEDIAFFASVPEKSTTIRPCKASVLHLDFTSMKNFVKKNNQSGMWFTYFLNNYHKDASKLSISKYFRFRYFAPLFMPFVFITQSILLFVLTLIDNYSTLYFYPLYRCLYSISFIYGFCLYTTQKRQLRLIDNAIS